MAAEVRIQGFDKFYTIPSIVDICINSLTTLYDWTTWSLVVEPSAGSGNFYNKIPINNKIGLDIMPENLNIIQKDFFTYEPELDLQSNILTIGNPPFGKISSLAIKFFNHAAKWSNVIAFIIPKTFRKISVQNRLDNKFHLIHDEDIPSKPCSFDPPMSVKCCFQIWKKSNLIRENIILETSHEDWTFLSYGPLDDNGQPTPPNGADFALRAYGGKCGYIQVDRLTNLRPKSWHFIKANIEVQTLINRFELLDYSNSQNTARQNSIGRGELVTLYSNKYNSN
jgi:hypothetical protein